MQLERAAALAPGGIGNIGPGLDVLGMAVTGPGDRVIAERTGSSGVVMADAGHPDLPREADKNAAGIAAAAVLGRAGARNVGVRLTLEKRLALSGGQGGSAASAVAGAVAVNRLLGNPLDAIALFECALVAESQLSGHHGDNLASALFGGVILVRSLTPTDIISLPFPADLRIVLAHPAQRLKTADARKVLPTMLERGAALSQMANVAAMVAAFASGDIALLGRGLDDQIAEPARAVLLPGFVEAKAAALKAGALAGSISGAGPTSFYITGSDATAALIEKAVHDEYASRNILCDTRTARVSPRGALTLPEDATSA
ncbi:MAG TPA: homoserine kinase [Gemmatimonadaceae bacterium]|jgi:homoserine kinase|nr:homoserine kinase [Gemmatimonadaceae bacterium]